MRNGRCATVGLCAFLFISTSGVSAASLQSSPQSRERLHEYLRGALPDDPPGVAPLVAAPGGPPTVLRERSLNVDYVQVNIDAQGRNIPGDAANEPSIAVDPTQPGRMAIGWRQFDTTASNFREGGWAYSQDRGRTWTFPGVLEEGVFRSDPVLDFDAQGNFYYNSLSFPGGNFRCQVFRSTDGGVTWGPEVDAFGGDKAWMVIDRTGGLGDGHLYQAWSVFAGCCAGDTFNRSTDGAASFEIPVGVPLMPVFGTLAVAPGGELYVSGADPNDFSTFLVARSSSARDPLVTPTFDFTTSIDLGGSLVIGAGPNPAGLLGQPSVAVDPVTNAVYLLGSVDPPGGDPMEVHFVRSLDGGMTWSAPVRVNDDPPGNGAWQWFATMSVAPNGRIDVVWNDTRRLGLDNRSQLFYACSTDGGLTWSPNRAMTPVWNSHVGFPNQDKIGDYYDMISDDVGAHLAFAATFNGEQDVYYLRIRP